MARGWGWNSKPEDKPDKPAKAIDPDTVETVNVTGDADHQSYKVGPGNYNDGQPHSYVNCYCKATADHQR